MAILSGRHHLSPEHGRITLHTSRDGLAAQAGHDLTIEAATWSGELTIGADQSPAGLEVTIDLNALQVIAGSGGIKPLSDKDKRDIAANARKTLRADRYPTATFTASAFSPAAAGGGSIDGNLTLAGQTRPLRIAVTQPSAGTYQATTTVRQTDFGIKPYSGMLGALRVSDAVPVTVDLELANVLAGKEG
ncbi:MAG TPA: YceI family protein [Streptosporangiaceae bacterium]|jgi:polyisoprenoid-binding protein YceI